MELKTICRCQLVDVDTLQSIAESINARADLRNYTIHAILLDVSVARLLGKREPAPGELDWLKDNGLLDDIEARISEAMENVA